MSECLHKLISHVCCSEMRFLFLTIHTRVVIINGLDDAAEVQLHVLLNEPRIKRAEVAVLVVDTERHKKSSVSHEDELKKKIFPSPTHQTLWAPMVEHWPEVCDLVLGQIFIALKAVLVRVKQWESLICQHFWFIQLKRTRKKRAIQQHFRNNSFITMQFSLCSYTQLLTALSGSPWKNLRSVSSRYCLQSWHLGGGVLAAETGLVITLFDSSGAGLWKKARLGINTAFYSRSAAIFAVSGQETHVASDSTLRRFPSRHCKDLMDGS